MAFVLLWSISWIIIYLSDNLLFDLIGFIIYNLAIYNAVFSDYYPVVNHRVLISYFITSSLVFIITAFTLPFQFLFPMVSYILLTTISAFILVLYPFTYFYIPFYMNLRFSLFFMLSVLSKFLLLFFIPLIIGLYYSYPLIVINFILVPFISLYSSNIIHILVFSSAFQLSFIILVIVFDCPSFALYYLVYYIAGFTLIYLLSVSKFYYSIKRVSLFYVLFSFIGLPPFIGFYFKWHVFNIVANYDSLVILILYLTLNVVGSYIYLMIWNYYSFMYSNKRTFNCLPRSYSILFYLFLYWSLFPLDCILIFI